MFAGEPDASVKAKKIADYLWEPQKLQVAWTGDKNPGATFAGRQKVKDLGAMGPLYEAVTVLYCCFDILLGNTGVYKIFENCEAAVIRQQQQMMLQQLLPGGDGSYTADGSNATDTTDPTPSVIHANPASELQISVLICATDSDMHDICDI